MMVVTKTELATELQIALSGVSKLIAQGMPVRRDNRIDFAAACRWIVDNGGANNDRPSKAYQSAREILLVLPRQQSCCVPMSSKCLRA